MTAPTFAPPALTEFQEHFLREWSEDLQTTGAPQGTGALCEYQSGSPEYKSFCCLGRAVVVLQDKHADWLDRNGFRVEYRKVPQVRHSDPNNPYSDTIRMFVIDEQLSDAFGKEISKNGVLPARLSALLGLGSAQHAESDSVDAGVYDDGPLGLSQANFYTANDDHNRVFAEIGVAVDMALRGDLRAADRQLAYDDESDDDES